MSKLLTTTRLPPIHPGEILREEFLVPLGLSAYRLAQEILVPLPKVNDVVREKRGISADTALRLAKYFGTSAEFWANLQARYDLEIERDRKTDQLAAITAFHSPVSTKDTRSAPHAAAKKAPRATVFPRAVSRQRLSARAIRAKKER